MTDSRQQILNKIVHLIEEEHHITIGDENKQHILHLLNQMHGRSHKTGLEEGIKVARQFNKLQHGQ